MDGPTRSEAAERLRAAHGAYRRAWRALAEQEGDNRRPTLAADEVVARVRLEEAVRLEERTDIAERYPAVRFDRPADGGIPGPRGS